MPTIDVEKPRPPCPPGDHLLVLSEVVTYMPKSGYGGKEPQEGLIWRFLSSQKDEDGNYYEMPVFTGKRYGNSKATLTWLLDMIHPGITPEVAEGLNTDRYVGSKFQGPVKNEINKDTGKKYPVFVYLRPVSAAQAAADAATAGKPDPFAAESPGDVLEDPELGRAACQWKDCNKLLTADEIRGCRNRFGEARFCTEHGWEKIRLESPTAVVFKPEPIAAAADAEAAAGANQDIALTRRETIQVLHAFTPEPAPIGGELVAAGSGPFTE